MIDDERELTPEEFDAACHEVGEQVAAEYARIVREALAKEQPPAASAALSLSAADKEEIAEMIRAATPAQPVPPPSTAIPITAVPDGLGKLAEAVAALAARPNPAPVVRIEPGAVVVNNLPPAPQPPKDRVVRRLADGSFKISEE